MQTFIIAFASSFITWRVIQAIREHKEKKEGNK